MLYDWAYDNRSQGRDTHTHTHTHRHTQVLCSLLTTAASVCFLIGHFLAVIFTQLLAQGQALKGIMDIMKPLSSETESTQQRGLCEVI